MHPNTFLRTFWRNEFRAQVFVAMSFEPRFDERFETVIRPAIEGEPLEGLRLTAYRVDNSRTGDSILTDIADGISHSHLVLADVSVVDEGRYVEQPIRNANVMYEVVVALACRTPAEVLLIRDDSKKFLFDVSTIPHMTMDFSRSDIAVSQLRDALKDRIKEKSAIADARVQMAARRLTQLELHILKTVSEVEEGQAADFSTKAGGGSVLISVCEPVNDLTQSA